MSKINKIVIKIPKTALKNILDFNSYFRETHLKPSNKLEQ